MVRAGNADLFDVRGMVPAGSLPGVFLLPTASCNCFSNQFLLLPPVWRAHVLLYVQ